MRKIASNEPSSISHAFKIAMVMLIFFLAMFRLVDIFYLPAFDASIDIIPDMVPIIVVLFIIIYLWVQEVKDYHKLLRLNKELLYANDQLKEAEVSTIAALVKAEEEKDAYTYGHSDRVTKISLAIADAMKLSDGLKTIISRAGLLHDIGKIGITDSVLCKKDKLTDEEWCEIKSHPEKGAEILRPLKFLSNEINILVHHHERYDGNGYPEGLREDQIPLGSEILAVADAFDAMNSKRAYREPLSRETIMSELKKGSGTQHSPEVTEVFLQLLEKKPELWNR